MGSSQEEQLLHSLSQLGQDTGLPDDMDGARPRAALLERHLLEGEKQAHSSGQGPYFYIGGTNGASIISSYCKGKGWQRIQDSRREDYKLKWCEVKCRDNYYSFREGSGGGGPGAGLQPSRASRAEPGAAGCPGGSPAPPPAPRASQDSASPPPPPPPGEQLLYQIPNNKLLTTKIGLLSALREYSRVVSKIHKTSFCTQAK